jgi:hypothetical protein
MTELRSTSFFIVASCFDKNAVSRDSKIFSNVFHESILLISSSSCVLLESINSYISSKVPILFISGIAFLGQIPLIHGILSEVSHIIAR